MYYLHITGCTFNYFLNDFVFSVRGGAGSLPIQVVLVNLPLITAGCHLLNVGTAGFSWLLQKQEHLFCFICNVENFIGLFLYFN